MEDNNPTDCWLDDDAALPPAAIVIRLAAELGDDDLIDITQDDG